MKRALFLLLFCLASLQSFAQTPAKMSYQAVIRDDAGKLVTNAQVGVQISILQGSATGSPIYEERHSTNVNANGLMSFIIGAGNVVFGDFNGIDWAKGPYFVETSTDPTGGTDYTITGTSPLLSVPYALHSKSAETLSGTIDASQILNLKDDVTGGGVDGSESAFTNWDKDATDDFSGAYQDLTNTPRLFSGNYKDLSGRPSLYDRHEVDSLVAATGSDGTVQSLELNNGELSITGGNSVSFGNWDTDASDDFSGNYGDLNGRPELFSGSYTDLKNRPQLFSGSFRDLTDRPLLYTRAQVDSVVAQHSEAENTVQSLKLTDDKLTISEGNSVSFTGWDRDSADDFDGKYSSLQDIPEIYTKAELDSIKLEIISRFQIYFKKSVIVPFTSSRNLKRSDVGNTIECTSSATLTISAGMDAIKKGDVINLEAHNGANLTIKAAPNVTINYVKGREAKFNSEPGQVRFGLLRKRGENEYIISGQ